MGFQPYTDDLTDASYAATQHSPRRHKSLGFIKRATDILVSGTAIVFLLPVLIPIAIAIRLSDGGPAIFAQKRAGLNGQTIRVFKFRTMVVDAQARLDKVLASDPEARRQWEAMAKLDNDPRITKFGDFLRKSSLDELPQLFNIFRGDMSLVGPRPIPLYEIERYGQFFRDYCAVRPGLTGLWQVSGRSDTDYNRRVQLDVEYVDRWSYAKDIQIIFKTVPAVLNSDGAR
ncbi:MAG: sugar transferase [Henriciella sp.]|nr:sugar transferase [Henriciella sp.]